MKVEWVGVMVKRETVTDPHWELWFIVIDIQDFNDEHSL